MSNNPLIKPALTSLVKVAQAHLRTHLPVGVQVTAYDVAAVTDTSCTAQARAFIGTELRVFSLTVIFDPATQLLDVLPLEEAGVATA